MECRNRRSPRRAASSWPLLLLIVVAAAGLFIMRRGVPPSGGGMMEAPIRAGLLLPPLEVAGWLPANGSAGDLAGQVVLVDCWASWCGPCRAKMPKLVEFYQRFQSQGLVVLGLTPEEESDRATFESYVSSVDGLDWPIGYGAGLPLRAMGIEAYPTLILFDASGRSVWSGHGFSGLEEALIRTL